MPARNLDQAYGDLENRKSVLLAELANWPCEQLVRRPAQNQWSAVEVVDHLVRTEVAILDQARRGLSQPRRISPVDHLRTRFLQMVFVSDRKVKVPAGVTSILPGSDLQLWMIVERWDGSRLALQEFMQAHGQHELVKGIFRHPVGGWMGLPEILNFFDVHLVHHGYQLGRIRTMLSDVEPANAE